MKYEAFFGDQSLFDNAPLGAELVGHGGGFYKNSQDGPIYCGGCTFTTDEYRNIGFIAARRIIEEPKRWTVEDQKAARLPEVGAKVDGGKVVFVNGFNVVTELKSGAVIVSSPKTFLNTFNPIETPEEKAARLREEWCIKALSSCSILSGMQNYELKRLGGYIKDIYDALLSGDIPVPSAPEQNK